MKVLRTVSLGSNFTGSYNKKECTVWSNTVFFTMLTL